MEPLKKGKLTSIIIHYNFQYCRTVTDRWEQLTERTLRTNRRPALLTVRILSTDTKSAGRQTLYHPPLPRKYPRSHYWDAVYRPSKALHGPYASFVIRRIHTDRNFPVYLDRYSAGILVNPQHYCIVTVLKLLPLYNSLLFWLFLWKWLQRFN